MNIKPKDKVTVNHITGYLSSNNPGQVVSFETGVVISTHTYKNGVEVVNVNGNWIEVDGKKTKVLKS